MVFEDLMICKYFLAYTRTEVEQFCNTLIQHMESVKKSIDERAEHKRQYDRRVNKRQMQTNGIESGKQDTSNSSGNNITHVVDADIRPVNDQVPFDEKCVFNANHDACITKFLKEVNSRAKIQPNKTRNSNKPVDPTSHNQKPGRKIITGHKFSPNKSSDVHEKTNTPRSCLMWIPTGRIFNTAGLKCVPTGKTFTSSTTKVDCEPLNGSNECITNPYECDQTLNDSAGTLNLSAGTFYNPEKERLGFVC
ncbi:hypothetical protein Tco_0926093 [Tanacetum coccineum]|uniref:Sushi domain-containing protein n=1 Tax=Tanacetum coccineum TaxID=301880 RepID=A0ABQ5D9S1_9ASTR